MKIKFDYNAIYCVIQNVGDMLCQEKLFQFLPRVLFSLKLRIENTRTFVFMELLKGCFFFPVNFENAFGNSRPSSSITAVAFLCVWVCEGKKITNSWDPLFCIIT